MSLYNETLARIERNAEVKKNGGHNGIPYPFERLAQFQPCIDKESVIALTSFTGAAKSKFIRYVFMMWAYEFAIRNNYPLLIDVYKLEDSAVKEFKAIICHLLYAKHKIRISQFDLDSKFRELSSDIRQKIKGLENYLQDFSNVVRIKDTITNPYGIHLDLMKTANELGEVKYEEYKDQSGDTRKKIVGFTPKDQTHWIGILDGINNIDSERHHRIPKEAMDQFVSKQVRLLYTKIFKMTWVIVHQQSLESEKQQFTNTGGSILEKIKPSLANLGGTKEVARSYHLLFSLFNPHKFKIENYRGYNIGLIGNNFRDLEIIKNNDGYDNISVPLFFDGTAEYFRELPHSEKQKDELTKFYEWLSKERLRQQTNNLLFN